MLIGKLDVPKRGENPPTNFYRACSLPFEGILVARDLSFVFEDSAARSAACIGRYVGKRQTAEVQFPSGVRARHDSKFLS
jgi:hypothetical protein